MYPNEAFDYLRYSHIRIEYSEGLGFPKLDFDLWLLLYFLSGIITIWEVKRLVVIFKDLCPVRYSSHFICLLGLKVENAVTNVSKAKGQNRWRRLLGRQVDYQYSLYLCGPVRT